MYLTQHLTLAGTEEERGIIIWRQVPDSHKDENNSNDNDTKNLSLKTYDIPFISSYIQKWNCSKYIPFLPSFSGFDNARFCCKGARYDQAETEVDVIAEETCRDQSDAGTAVRETTTDDKKNLTQIC